MKTPSRLERSSIAFAIGTLILAACGSDTRPTTKPSSTLPTSATAFDVVDGHSSVVQYLQEGLSRLGIYKGPVNGEFTDEIDDLRAGVCVEGFTLESVRGRRRSYTARFRATPL